MKNKVSGWVCSGFVISFSVLMVGCPTGSGTPDSFSALDAMFADSGVLDGNGVSADEVLLTQNQVFGLDNLSSKDLTFVDVALPSTQSLVQFFAALGAWDESRKQPIYDKSDDVNSVVTTFGFAPGMQKNYLIARMIGRALELTNRDRWVYASDGANAPAQTGIGYVFGSADHASRSSFLGSAVSGGVCKESLHGLDGLGYFKEVWDWSSLPIAGRTPGQYAQSLNSVFIQHPAWNMQYVSIPIPAGTTAPSAAEFATGDVVLWKNHIGMVARTGSGDTYILQSHGSPLQSGDCALNYGASRGPRALKYQDMISVMGLPSQVFRLVHKPLNLSGTWQVTARCAASKEILLSQNVEIDEDRNSVSLIIEIEKDRDGNPAFKTELSAIYNMQSGEIRGGLTATAAGDASKLIRSDAYLFQFQSVDTGYFPLMPSSLNRDPRCSGAAEMRWLQLPLSSHERGVKANVRANCAGVPSCR